MADQTAAVPPAEPPPSYDAASEQSQPLLSASEEKQKLAQAQQPQSSLPVRPRPSPSSFDLPVLNAARNRRTILASASPRRRQLLAQIGLSNVEVIPSKFAEDIPKYNLSPFEYVLQTASAKALATYKSELEANQAASKTKPRDPELIIAADTIVVAQNGTILEKPKSEKHHIDMLMSLRDGGRSPNRANTTAGGLGMGAEMYDLDLGRGIRGEGAVSAPDKKRGAWHQVFTAVAVLAPLESARDPGYAMETTVEETSVKFADVTDELILAYVKTREGADKAGGYGIQGMGSLLVERVEGTFDNVVGLPLRATVETMEKVLRIAMADEAGVDGDGVDEEELDDE